MQQPPASKLKINFNVDVKKSDIPPNCTHLCVRITGSSFSSNCGQSDPVPKAEHFSSCVDIDLAVYRLETNVEVALWDMNSALGSFACTLSELSKEGDKHTFVRSVKSVFKIKSVNCGTLSVTGSLVTFPTAEQLNSKRNPPVRGDQLLGPPTPVQLRASGAPQTPPPRPGTPPSSFPQQTPQAGPEVRPPTESRFTTSAQLASERVPSPVLTVPVLDCQKRDQQHSQSDPGGQIQAVNSPTQLPRQDQVMVEHPVPLPPQVAQEMHKEPLEAVPPQQKTLLEVQPAIEVQPQLQLPPPTQLPLYLPSRPQPKLPPQAQVHSPKQETPEYELPLPQQLPQPQPQSQSQSESQSQAQLEQLQTQSPPQPQSQTQTQTQTQTQPQPQLQTQPQTQTQPQPQTQPQTQTQTQPQTQPQPQMQTQPQPQPQPQLQPKPQQVQTQTQLQPQPQPQPQPQLQQLQTQPQRKPKLKPQPQPQPQTVPPPLPQTLQPPQAKLHPQLQLRPQVLPQLPLYAQQQHVVQGIPTHPPQALIEPPKINSIVPQSYQTQLLSHKPVFPPYTPTSVIPQRTLSPTVLPYQVGPPLQSPSLLPKPQYVAPGGRPRFPVQVPPQVHHETPPAPLQSMPQRVPFTCQKDVPQALKPSTKNPTDTSTKNMTPFSQPLFPSPTQQVLPPPCSTSANATGLPISRNSVDVLRNHFTMVSNKHCPKNPFRSCDICDPKTWVRLFKGIDQMSLPQEEQVDKDGITMCGHTVFTDCLRWASEKRFAPQQLAEFEEAFVREVVTPKLFDFNTTVHDDVPPLIHALILKFFSIAEALITSGVLVTSQVIAFAHNSPKLLGQMLGQVPRDCYNTPEVKDTCGLHSMQNNVVGICAGVPLCIGKETFTLPVTQDIHMIYKFQEDYNASLTYLSTVKEKRTNKIKAVEDRCARALKEAEEKWKLAQEQLLKNREGEISAALGQAQNDKQAILERHKEEIESLQREHNLAVEKIQKDNLVHIEQLQMQHTSDRKSLQDANEKNLEARQQQLDLLQQQITAKQHENEAELKSLTDRHQDSVSILNKNLLAAQQENVRLAEHCERQKQEMEQLQQRLTTMELEIRTLNAPATKQQALVQQDASYIQEQCQSFPLVKKLAQSLRKAGTPEVDTEVHAETNKVMQIVCDFILVREDLANKKTCLEQSNDVAAMSNAIQKGLSELDDLSKEHSNVQSRLQNTPESDNLLHQRAVVEDHFQQLVSQLERQVNDFLSISNRVTGVGLNEREDMLRIPADLQKTFQSLFLPLFRCRQEMGSKFRQISDLQIEERALISNAPSVGELTNAFKIIHAELDATNEALDATKQLISRTKKKSSQVSKWSESYKQLCDSRQCANDLKRKLKELTEMKENLKKQLSENRAEIITKQIQNSIAEVEVLKRKRLNLTEQYQAYENQEALIVSKLSSPSLQQYNPELAWIVKDHTKSTPDTTAAAPHTSTTASASECPVCLGPMGNNVIAFSPCGHTVCKQCCDLITASSPTPKSQTCPTCRTKITQTLQIWMP
ncbi:hypothetical protein Pelo_3001 [Pelomyxa schiedti]|nr:hypothetical protein Pelo_3001 [Pelomyxa schiedti]